MNPFFRRLPGDGRFVACVPTTIPATPGFPHPHYPGQINFKINSYFPYGGSVVDQSETPSRSRR